MCEMSGDAKPLLPLPCCTTRPMRSPAGCRRDHCHVWMPLRMSGISIGTRSIGAVTISHVTCAMPRGSNALTVG